MAKRKIPSNMQPWKANINGKEYEYQSGITADVPDEVAALIDFIDESAPKRDPKAAQRAIEGEVTQIVKDNFAGGVGYEETTEGVMLPETSFEIVAGNPGVLISDSFPYTLEVGQDYTVTLDGEAQTCTAIETATGGALTNTSLDDCKAGNGWFLAVPDGEVRLQTNDSSLVGAHTISISGSVNTVRKIDSKYMPIKALLGDSSGNLFTDFTSFEQHKPPSVPLTYDEAYSLYESCCSVYIFTNNYRRYTVTEIRGANWDVSGSGFKYIYFEVMDGTTLREFSVANPNYSGSGEG